MNRTLDLRTLNLRTLNLRILSLTALTIFALALGGCLSSETRQVLYLETNGSVTWMVLEHNVHSTHADVEQRAAEEREYIEAAHHHDHTVAQALAKLGGQAVSSRILRLRRPFVVFTQARFASPAELAETLLGQLGVPARITLQGDGQEGSLALELRLNEADEDTLDDHPELWALIDDFATYRLVLSEGCFDHAEGFKLENRATAALLPEPDIDAIESAGGKWHLALSWGGTCS